MRELRWGKLRAMIGVRIPYDVFELGKERLAIDAIKGTLDLYRIDDVSDEFEELPILERQLSQEQTCSSLQKRLARQGQLVGDHVAVAFVPYWVGIFERNEIVHIEVLDAVRGRLEGAKMRDMIEECLTRRREDREDREEETR